MRRGWTIAVVVVVVLAVAGFAGWWFLLRDDAPPEARLVRCGSTSSAEVSAPADGTWTVQPGEDVFVGYRVTEQYAGETIEKTAVGRSPDVAGSVEVRAATVPAARVEVDMTALTSDSSQRDDRLRTHGLETDRYPSATFVLAEPIDLGPAPVPDVPLDVSASGDLSLHGVTRRLTFPLRACWAGDVIELAGQAPIVMADYGIEPPSVGGLVSVAGEGVFELQLTLVRV